MVFATGSSAIYSVVYRNQAIWKWKRDAKAAETHIIILLTRTARKHRGDSGQRLYSVIIEVHKLL